ncbi:RHS repeat-associated core domain-containing protein [Vibrio mediterranei]|uniref:RHS repeat-associated core domain-containing protein n=1 Tax=Vibrio mediterranei TaxID=689 RepID=UPI00148DAC9B|nr:RHS repeat-associated core domain-containing protein [Vibrio mediterranei]NOH29412.1 type IV secretion protein Rhs [Vibrio mediterranei]
MNRFWYQGLLCVMLLSTTLCRYALASTDVLTGDFAVAGGQVDYRIPIVAATGRADLTPSIALTYSSSRQNGPLGVGWQLQGVSSIYRCPRNLQVDKAWGGVNYDGNDRFCLDGQRLIAIKGAPGASHTEYRTEIDDYRKIVSYERQGNGPKYFKVFTKEGKVFEYGVTADSRAERPGGAAAYKWAVNRIHDVNQRNSIHFRYAENQSAGSHRITTITYVGGELRFFYEARNDTRFRYLNDNKLTSNVRLRAIESRSDTKQLLSTYHLTYRYSGATGRSLISAIKECASSQVCKEPIRFNWLERSKAELGGAKTIFSENVSNIKLYDMEKDGQFEIFSLASDRRKVLQNSDAKTKASGWIYIYTNAPNAPCHDFEVADWNANNKPYFRGFCAGSKAGRMIAYPIRDGKRNFFFTTTTSLFPQARSDAYPVDTNGNGIYTIENRCTDCHFYDFDGDGRNTEYLYQRPGYGSIKFYRNGKHTQTLSAPANAPYDVVDLNNDGYLDLVIRNGKTIHTYYYTGINFVAGANVSIKEASHSLADVNSDGYVDILSGNTAYLNVNGTFKGKTLIQPYSTATYANVVDVNSDAWPDNLAGKTIQRSTAFAQDRIGSIQEYGLQYQLTYRPLSSDVHVQERHFKYPFRNTTPTSYVVSQYEKRPRGYNSTKHTFKYYGAKSQLKSGDFLGFRQIVEMQYGEFLTKIERVFEQGDLALAGQPKRISEYRQGKKVSERLFSYQKITHKASGDRYYYQRRNHQTITKTFDVTTGALEKQELVAQTINKAGNVTKVDTTLSTNVSGIADGFVSQTYQYLSVNLDDANYWRLGAVNRIESLLIDRGTQRQRKEVTTFAYNGNGLVTTETVMGSNYESAGTLSTAKKRIKRYEYDPWGNIKLESVEGAELPKRVQRSSYDARGLYATASTNALGHVTRFVYDTKGRLVKSISPLKSRTTQYTYTPFHRVQKQTMPGVNNSENFVYQLGAQCAHHRPTTAYCITTTRTSGTKAATHYDVEGREVRQWHQSFNGDTVTIDTDWDRNGRKTRVTQPYFLGGRGSVQSIHFTYDALGRETKKVEPTQSGVANTTTRYERFKTTVKDARGFSHVTLSNIFGHITKKIEPLGAYQTYQYYPDGKLRHSTDAKGHTTHIRYDSLGHRLSLNDPDLSVWQYRYNAAGELVYKRDAKGNVTNVTYDTLGRKVKQVEGGKTSTWRYDERGALGTLSGFSGHGSTTDYYYNGQGLTEEVRVTVGTEKFSTYYFYDNFERLSREVRPNGANPTLSGATLKQKNDAHRLAVEYVYNPHGYVSAVRSPKTYADDVFSSPSFRDDIRQLLNQAIAQATVYLDKAERYAKQESFYQSKAAATANKTVNINTLNAGVAAAMGQVSDRYKQWCHPSGDCYLRPAAWVILHGPVATPIDVTLEGAIYRLEKTLSNRKRNGVQYFDAKVTQVSESHFNSRAVIAKPDMLLTDYDGDGQKNLMVQPDMHAAKVDNATNNELQFLAGDWSHAATVANTRYRLYTDLAQQLINLSAKVVSLSDMYCEFANQLGGSFIDTQHREQCDNTQKSSQADHLNLILTQSELDAAQNDKAYVYYWQRRDTDAFDHTLSETLGNGLANTYVHDAKTGRPVYITTHQASQLFDAGLPKATALGRNLRLLKYDYDNHNNVTSRFDEQLGITDKWTYDGLDRVRTNTISLADKARHGLNNPDLKSAYTFNYDVLGNLTQKTGTGTYTYSGNKAGPHAVTSIGNRRFEYDANGNLLRSYQQGASSNERTLTWTAFNKPSKIVKNGKSVEFLYDANHNRYLKKSSDGSETFYFGKTYERVRTSSGAIDHKHFIYADGKLIALNTQEKDGQDKLKNKQIRYLHYDALNSVDMITDGYGLVVERRSYDTWGKQRKVIWKDDQTLALATLTNRGYTGHETIEEVGLVHMNGRVYDQEIGRFLSPDPYVQSPYVTTSFNRYAYVWNNPLKYTDPTGYYIPRGTSQGQDENGNRTNSEKERNDYRNGRRDKNNSNKSSKSNQSGSNIVTVVQDQNEEWSFDNTIKSWANGLFSDEFKLHMRFAGEMYQTGGYSHTLASLDADAQESYGPSIQRAVAVGIAISSVVSRGRSAPKPSLGSALPNVTKGAGKAPDFVVSPGGTAFPVPKGATGPTPVVNPGGKTTGSAFTGGKGGTNGKVDTIRIMDPTPPRGKSPGYPNGYIKYENKSGQGVDPYTGRTLSNKDSHFPID